MKKMMGFLVGFRKFAIMMSFMAVMVGFRIYGLIDGAQFSENTQLAVVAYFATNIGEHVINLGKEWITNKFKDLTGKKE